jgi:hypothetical protein
MYLDSKKMNNYAVIRIGSVLILAIALVIATFTFPLGTRTSANLNGNNPPNLPSNPVPANASTNISIIANLNWTGGDPDNNIVTYDVYFGTTSPPSKKVANQSALLYDPGSMNYTTHYYWKIIAWDNQSASTVGPQWEFTTKPNVPPNTPNKPSPANGSTDVLASADLNWTGGDLYNDTVTYDVYFGTTSPPSKKVANQSALLYDPGSMNYTTHYYWKIIAWDNHSASTVGPQWTFTTGLKPNTPPNTPSNPSPTNGATNVLLTATLGWTAVDPDGDPVKFDVYFGTASSPPKVMSNQSALSYNPGTLTYNTNYNWKIVAWDNHSASTKGPLWHFTTKQAPPIKVIISKPLENTFYFQDKELMSLSANTIIYGPITITAEVTSGTGVKRVEFYIDGNLKENVTTAPYTYLWRPLIQFNGLSLKHTIKVIVYDNEGNKATDELNVTKWRFHPLPFIVAGIPIASKLLLHTTVRGFIFNFKESMTTVSFYALRIHYKTDGLFRSAKGVINFRICTGGTLVGPIKMIRMGTFHNFAYGTFTFLGDIHYNTGDFGQGNLANLLRNALTPKNKSFISLTL